MRRRRALTALVVAAGLAAGGAVAVTVASAGAAGSATPTVRPLCAAKAPVGHARCFALARTDAAAAPHAAAPGGYGPADLRSAYGLPASGGGGATIGIVDAYDNPTVEADLAVYRQQYGLPACTTANGCFRKVDQRGGTDYPARDDGWAGEIALDVDMVSAACPACRIVLVEADSNNLEDLGIGVDQAVAQGAKFVSNSYGGSEDSSQTGLDTNYYKHPGVAITASTGDNGYGVSYPASSSYVTAVGGTDLQRVSGGRGWSETVWNDEYGAPGSGCSELEAKPSFQRDTGCAKRAVADVSAVADPAHGVAVYTKTGGDGWSIYGGTSAAAPVIAATYALAGTPDTGSYPNSYPYASSTALNDVTSGDNGSCATRYLCTAGAGYDGPTGLGTPKGLVAFRAPGPHGTIGGTVRSGGQPVAGATVRAGTAATTTAADGSYQLTLRTGSYDVTAAAFGYATGTDRGVRVTENAATRADLTLTASPEVSVTGTVTDGSGHGWPLAASLRVAGDPRGTVVRTDPRTGRYTLPVPASASYQLQVTAGYPGYLPVEEELTVGAGTTTHDVRMTVDPTGCTAPGYAVSYGGLLEQFATPAAPAGWSVVDTAHTGSVWSFANPGRRANYTGGRGGFAIIDSDQAGVDAKQDSSLVTPAVDLSSFTTPSVSFHTDYYGIHGSTGAVDLSVDNGATWSTVWQHADDGVRRVLVTLPIPAAARHKQVRVRFHYTGGNSWWWQVDDVSIGSRSCLPAAGGLVVGRVTHPLTHGAGTRPLAGATVTSLDRSSQRGTSAADGTYWLFSSLTGRHSFAAGAHGYRSATAAATVPANGVAYLPFLLRPGSNPPAPGPGGRR